MARRQRHSVGITSPTAASGADTGCNWSYRVVSLGHFVKSERARNCIVPIRRLAGSTLARTNNESKAVLARVVHLAAQSFAGFDRATVEIAKLPRSMQQL